MNDKGARTPIAGLPAEDGALGRALADVEAKLATWLAAMNAALRAADAALEQPSAASTGDPPEQAPDSSAVGPPADGADGAAAAEACTMPAATPPDAHPEETDPAQAAAPASAEETQGSASPELPAEGGELPGEPAESTTCEQPESADDERLLASLDEQTQAAIRVKRRLFGDQKSVRELLDEMSRLPSVQQTTKPQPKRWWRR
jgi:hypothetical protein